jgi:hypothetical protein
MRQAKEEPRAMKAEEVCKRGRDIIAQLPPALIEEHRGEVILVDILSGDYEIGESFVAVDRVLHSRLRRRSALAR